MLLSESLKKNQGDCYDFVTKSVQSGQELIREQVYGIDLKVTRVMDDSKSVEKKVQSVQKDFEKVSDLQKCIEEMKRQMSEIERTELTKNNDILQNFVEQLKDFETRESNNINTNNQKFIETQQQLNSKS